MLGYLALYSRPGARIPDRAARPRRARLGFLPHELVGRSRRRSA